MQKSGILLRTLAVFFWVVCSGAHLAAQDYQVIEIGSVQESKNKDYLLIENDTLSIAYNFWSENGRFIFSIYNKTNKALYIDWKMSAVVVNGESFSYFNEKSYMTTQTRGEVFDWRNMSWLGQIIQWAKSNDGSGFRQVFGLSSGTYTEESFSVITNPVPGVVIPPGAYVRKSMQVLQSQPLNTGHPDSIRKVGRRKYVYHQHFTWETSPVRFRNFITYTSDPNGAERHSVDCQFYYKTISHVHPADYEVISGYHKTLGYPLYTCLYVNPKRFYLRFED
jgi:hypothetical protein